jgi:hypothetical protein
VLVNFIALAVLLYRHFAMGGADYFLKGAYVLFIGVLFYRGWRLKRRVSQLVVAAAAQCGLSRVPGSK